MKMFSYLCSCFRNSDNIKSSNSLISSINSSSTSPTMSSISTNHVNIGISIGYVTDCEGNYDYWMRYISKSLILDKRNNSMILKENCHLVYGGDVCDRGTGDIRLLCDLISLKRKYPDRVHFIMGNRDCNKLRLKYELHEGTALKCYPKVYWITNDPLSNKYAKEIDSEICDRNKRLKWILSNTMGAPISYESRRAELNSIKMKLNAKILTGDHDKLIINPSNYPCIQHEIDENKITQSFLDLIANKNKYFENDGDVFLHSLDFSESDVKLEIDSNLINKIDTKLDNKIETKTSNVRTESHTSESSVDTVDKTSYGRTILQNGFKSSEVHAEVKTSDIKSESKTSETRVENGKVYSKVKPRDSTNTNLSNDEFDEVNDYSGLLLEYLYHSKICLIIADVLFIHGALHPYNLGWLPPSKGSPTNNLLDDSRYISDIFDWANKINEFAKEEIIDYIDNSDSYLQELEEQFKIKIEKLKSNSRDCYDDKLVDELLEPIHWGAIGGYDHKQPGSRLLQYGMGFLPDKSVNPSVIYANYLNGGQPVGPHADVINSLKSKGINKIIVGHQPHGDAPVVIDEGGIQVISGDTSYSKNTLWNEFPKLKSKQVDKLGHKINSTDKSDQENPTNATDKPVLSDEKTSDKSCQSEKSEWSTCPNSLIHEILKYEIKQDKYSLNEVIRQVSSTSLSQPSNSKPNSPALSRIPSILGNVNSPSSYIGDEDRLMIIPDPTPDNTRGIAVSEIIIMTSLSNSINMNSKVYNDLISKIYIHGVLSNGYKYGFELPSPQYNKYIGKMTKDEFYVKAYGVSKHINSKKQRNGHFFEYTTKQHVYFLLSKGEKYDFKNKLIHENEIEKEFEL